MSLATLVVTVAPGAVSSDLEYYPVHIDMSLLPSTFWDFVKADGGDMRARAMSGNVKYPLDIITIDRDAQTGHCFVRVPLLAAGNQFRIDIGDDSLSVVDPYNTALGAYAVWRNFGPVFVGYDEQLYRRPWQWIKYPTVELNGDYIHASGGFLRAGRGNEPDINARSFSWIGKRTGGAANAAILSTNGEQTGPDDRETLYMRSDHTLGLWNSVDGWLTGSTWAANEMMQCGSIHAGTASRSIFKNGAIVATDTGCVLVPVDGNYKYFGAESNDVNAPLTCKFLFSYMFRGVLDENWLTFEYNNWFNPTSVLSYAVVDFREFLNMTILFAGTSIADFNLSGSPSATTTSGEKDTYVAEGISINSSGNPGVGIDFDTGVQDFWVGAYLIQTSGSGTPAGGLALFNKAFSVVNPLFQITADSGTNIPKAYYWNGSSETLFDAGTTIVAMTRWDLHVVISDTVGKFELYKNGLLDLDFTSVGSDTKLTAATSIDRVEFHCVGVGSTQWSGIIIADEDTRGMRLVQRLPTGAGNDTAWTGAYTDVDETGYSDADALTSASPNDVELFTYADLPSEFTASPIAAVIVSGRMKAAAVSPTTIQGVMRVNSVNYAEDAERALSLSYGPAQIIFQVNPETLSEWTATAINSAEFGVKSKA